MFPYYCNTYKEVLREAVNIHRERLPRFTFQEMAIYCRIQKTYLSKVINHDSNLSEDQLYLALEYLQFDETSVEYTLLLAAAEKSQLPARRSKLEHKIISIRNEKLKTENQIRVEFASDSRIDLTEYFLEPLLQVIHIHLTIKKYAKNPQEIANVLHLPSSRIATYLSALEKMELIRIHDRRSNQMWVEVIKNNLHLPQNSPIQNSYSSRMRLKAIEKIESTAADKNFRFSAIFTANQRAKSEIHASFLNWLQKTQRIAKESNDEAVYQFNFDLFNWTDEEV